MAWRDRRRVEDEADLANPPTRRLSPPLAVELAQTGELGLSASQYESLRARPTAPVTPRRLPNEQSRFQTLLDHQGLLGSERALLRHLALSGALTP